MIYECLIEPSFNQIWYGFRDTPDECYATSSTEGWILTFLIVFLISALLKILSKLLMNSPVSKLFNLDLIEKKFNLFEPKESEIENIKSRWWQIVMMVLPGILGSVLGISAVM